MNDETRKKRTINFNDKLEIIAKDKNGNVIKKIVLCNGVPQKEEEEGI